MNTAQQADSLYNRATYLVKKAIAAGVLRKLDGAVRCADCAKPAVVYDHRDYRRPLDVVPVCRSCNWKRGPGAPFKKGFVRSIRRDWMDPHPGTNYGAFDIGEGYSPLECVVRCDIREITEHQDRLAELARPIAMRKGDRWFTGHARYEFFKQHDPWFLWPVEKRA